MKTFKDLEFKSKFSNELCESIKSIVDYSSAKQAYLEFDNGYGVSVICGSGSYSSDDKPYECAVIFNGGLCYSTHITNDVVGYCTEENVTEIMKQIQAL